MSLFRTNLSRLLRDILVALTFTPTLASANVTLSAIYRPAANAFQILDCVSNWWDGFCGDEGAYLKNWESRSELSDLDHEFLKKYRSLRESYYHDEDQKEKDPTKNRNGLFATLGSISPDPIASAFYSVNQLEQGYRKLEEILSKDDLALLKSFFAHFSEKIQPYIKESKAFIASAAQLDRNLKKRAYQGFLNEVQHFYGVSFSLDYEALMVWWPPLDRDYAIPLGDHLILGKNPQKHLKWTDEDTVFHEVVHTISARQSLSQKRSITDQFLAGCDIRSQMRKGKILEEPLAVAIGQMLFLKRFNPKRFSKETNWYRDTWVSRYALALLPHVEKAFTKKTLLADSAFIEDAAKICKSLQQGKPE